MHFVDDIDLVARFDRAIAHTVEQVTHIVHTGPAGRVQFQNVHVTSINDGAAVTAFTG